LQYRRLSLVLNEKAGAMLGAAEMPDLAARLASGGALIRTIPPGALPDRLRAAMADADVVVVAGGDGTVACAASVLAGSGLTLGIVPGGTMNMLAKDLALPIGDPVAAIDVILAGQTRLIDVGMAGGEVFLCACMLGAPARMGRHRERARLDGPWRQWLKIGRAAWRVLSHPHTPRLNLTVDGVTYRLRTPSLTVTVNAVDDVEGRLFARPVLDGGKLCAYAVRRPAARDLIRVFLRLAWGRPRDDALLVLQGTRIRVSGTGASLRLLVDGEERLLASPLDFTLAPGALRVLAPA
jgi:diacylglycerol kinase family enzyme